MYTILDYLEHSDKSVIRSFTMDDIDKIVSLFEKNYKKTMGPTESKRHFLWEYINNPTGIVSILLAENIFNNELMAQYALLPKKLNVYDTNCLCSLSQDTITDEKYRGKGLFTLLAKRLYDIVKDKGFLFTYGFPNKNSAHGFFNKLGWIEIKPLPILFKPIFITNADYSTIPYFGKKLITRKMYSYGTRFHNFIFRGSIKSEFHFEEIKTFKPIFDELWERSIKGNIIVIRNNFYIKWRIFDKPENNYRVFLMSKNNETVGYFITSVINKFNLKMLFLIDFLLIDEHLVKCMLSFVDQIAVDERCYLISSMTPSLYIKKFYLAGYLKLSEKLFPQDLNFGFLPHNIKDGKLKENIAKIDHWYLTWSDIDVV